MSTRYRQVGRHGRVASRPGNGFAVASLILGIIAVVLFCYPHVSIPAAILAVIFGTIGRKRARRGASGRGMATAGLICGMFNLGVLALIFGLFCAGVTGLLVNSVITQ